VRFRNNRAAAGSMVFEPIIALDDVPVPQDLSHIPSTSGFAENLRFFSTLLKE
jgi:hypothetical protein